MNSDTETANCLKLQYKCPLNSKIYTVPMSEVFISLIVNPKDDDKTYIESRFQLQCECGLFHCLTLNPR